MFLCVVSMAVLQINSENQGKGSQLDRQMDRYHVHHACSRLVHGLQKQDADVSHCSCRWSGSPTRVPSPVTKVAHKTKIVKHHSVLNLATFSCLLCDATPSCCDLLWLPS